MDTSEQLTVAQGHLSQGQAQEALALAHPIANDQPANLAAQRIVAICLVAQQRFDEALPYCQRAAALLPQDGELRYALGFIYGSLGRFAESIPELDAALGLMPQHSPAKQALVYSLLKLGTTHAGDDPRQAEMYLDRAYKLDRGNADVASALLSHQMETHQRQKAINLYRDLSESVQQSAKVKSLHDRMVADPEFANLLRQPGIASNRPASSGPPAAVRAVQEVACPNCKRMIAEWAAICPHCNFRNRDVGNFQGRDKNLPTVIWQEVAYNIFSVLVLLNALWQIVAGFMGGEGLNDPYTMWNVTIGAATAFVGIGLLCQWEWIMFIAKILMILNILSFGLGFLMSMASGPLPMLLNLLGLILAAFMVYLINFVGG